MGKGLAHIVLITDRLQIQSDNAEQSKAFFKDISFMMFIKILKHFPEQIYVRAEIVASPLHLAWIHQPVESIHPAKYSSIKQ